MSLCLYKCRASCRVAFRPMSFLGKDLGQCPALGKGSGVSCPARKVFVDPSGRPATMPVCYRYGQLTARRGTRSSLSFVAGRASYRFTDSRSRFLSFNAARGAAFGGNSSGGRHVGRRGGRRADSRPGGHLV
jgi:hypothetical protein